MKNITLTIKKKWFDLILKGEKKQEYRELKEYYDRMFHIYFSGCMDCKHHYFKNHNLNNIYCKLNNQVVFGHEAFKCPNFVFDKMIYPAIYAIRFRNGYRKDSPELVIKLESVSVGFGRPEWGAEPGKLYYILNLGEILETKNLK